MPFAFTGQVDGQSEHMTAVSASVDSRVYIFHTVNLVCCRESWTTDCTSTIVPKMATFLYQARIDSRFRGFRITACSSYHSPAQS